MLSHLETRTFQPDVQFVASRMGSGIFCIFGSFQVPSTFANLYFSAHLPAQAGAVGRVHEKNIPRVPPSLSEACGSTPPTYERTGAGWGSDPSEVTVTVADILPQRPHFQNTLKSSK